MSLTLSIWDWLKGGDAEHCGQPWALWKVMAAYHRVYVYVSGVADCMRRPWHFNTFHRQLISCVCVSGAWSVSQSAVCDGCGAGAASITCNRLVSISWKICRPLVNCRSAADWPFHFVIMLLIYLVNSFNIFFVLNEGDNKADCGYCHDDNVIVNHLILMHVPFILQVL